jgi:penicillin-binding protein 1A
MGARTYFDKPAAKLNVLESATLIGMLKGTSYYNPVLNGDRAVKRRNVVLSQMAKRGVLSKNEFDRLKTRPMRLDFERQPEPVGKAPHFAAHVRKWLIDWADRNDYNLYSDGLVVYSTIDSRMQEFAEQAVYRQMQMQQAASDFEKGVSRHRMVSASPRAHPGPRRRVQTVAWRTRSDLLDAFVRESAAYRAAVAEGTAPELALKQMKGNAEFMARLSADKTRLETGFVAVDPTNGHVKAWVGSRDFATDQFDHVAQAKRQPGSTFKPFVYGAALEEGMVPETRFTDATVEIPMDDGSVWRPTDASGPSGRQMTLREALAYSKNVITAQVMQEVGARKVVSFARRLGVNQSTLDPVPALSLGTSPVTLLEMVSAYSTIAGGGEFHKPVLVSRIVDKEGKVLDTFASDGKRAIPAKTAYDLTDMMRSVVNQGTGRAIRTQFGLRADVAGKTGTTQDNTDGWFILMHPRLVAGVWVGFNDARVTMSNSQWGEGARTALPIVGDFYRRTSHTRLVDVGARFAAPPDSFFDSFLNKVHALFDREKPEREPSRPHPRDSLPSRMPTPHAEPEIRLSEMERITDQARQAEQSLDEQREATPAELVKAFEEGNPGIVDIPGGEESGGSPAN